MKVCVIGAGIVGCAAAFELARHGFDVELLDAADEPGRGASFANGAQLSYSYVEPLASPATLRLLPSMLWLRDSPVKLRLQADWRQWLWGLQFLQACRAPAARQTTAFLLELARESRLVLEGWVAQEHWPSAFRRNGKLVLCPDAASMRAQERQVRLQARLGCRQSVLSADECRRQEPALAHSRVPMAGGVWTPDECVADPHQLCRHLVQGLRSRGGRFVPRTRVTGFDRQGQRFTCARADNGTYRADAFVLAAGPAATQLAAGFGVRLPIYPVKGYSITVPMRGPLRQPVASVTHLGLKTVFAPLGGHLRVAAMAEIAGYGLEIPPDRLQLIVRSVDAMFPGLCDTREPSAWAGLRPATPTSRPIVARVGESNMFLNVGHGALGLTLAAGTARRMAMLLLALERPNALPSAVSA